MHHTISDAAELRARAESVQARLAALLRHAAAPARDDRDCAIAEAIDELEREFAFLMEELRARVRQSV